MAIKMRHKNMARCAQHCWHDAESPFDGYFIMLRWVRKFRNQR